MSYLSEAGFGAESRSRLRSLHVQRGCVALLLVLLLASIQMMAPNAAVAAVGPVLVAKSADLVLGQPSFTTSTSGTSTTQLNAPQGAAPDGQGNVYVADTANNRVLRFPASCLSAATNGCAADLVLGQADFISSRTGSYPTQLRGPEGVVVGAEGSLFVVDTGNNRVLHFPATCLSTHTNGCAADAVLGQPNPTGSASGTSTTLLKAPEGAASDGQGGLFVADTGNNRVIHVAASCLSASTNGCAADLVLGKPTFTVSGYGASQTQLESPLGLTGDGSGGLYVADGPNRVLHFPATCLSKRVSGCAADLVLGQADFTANSYAVSATQLNSPLGLDGDGRGGIFVADTGNNRVLHFPPSNDTKPVGYVTVGTTAAIVYGQHNFTAYHGGISKTQVNQPTGVALDPTGGIYVADSANNRVLHFPVSCLSAHTNGCAADLVLGEPDFTSHGGGAGQKHLAAPWGVAVDSKGNVYVADSANNRVLHFPVSCLSAHTNGCAADLVLGQSGFTGGGNATNQTRLSDPLGVVVDPNGNVYVADANNNRVVRFPASCHASGCAADLVLGPDFTWTNGGVNTSRFQDPVRLAYDPTGGLYVADNANNRVLHFPASCLGAHTSGCAADLVLGEPDFVFTKTGANQSQVNAASGVGVEAAGGVYIADFYNNRVTHYPADCLASHTNGCPADFVLGQPDFTSHASAASPSQMANPDSVAIDCAGGLYVTDRNNNRVMYFPPPTSATSPRDCRLPQTPAADISLWVWLIVGLCAVVVGAVIGAVLVKRRAKKPATLLGGPVLPVS